MNLNIKLLGGGIALVAAPLLVATVAIEQIAANTGSQALEQQASQRLIAVRDIKQSQIEGYFETINNQVLTFANDKMIIDAMDEFNSGFKSFKDEVYNNNVSDLERQVSDFYNREFSKQYKVLNSGNNVDTSALVSRLDDAGIALQYQYIVANNNPLGSKHNLDAANDQSHYSQAHRTYHPHIRDYLEKFGFYDIFLVDADSGHIVYSVFKELDYATSLKSGPYANSGIAKAFKAANRMNAGQAHLEDFGTYLPSYNGHASFIATPVFHDGKKSGVLIFQMPVDNINAVMTHNEKWADAGLGNSGEVYLVGPNRMMRSNSRFLIEDASGYYEAIDAAGMDKHTVDLINAKGTSIGLHRIDSESAKKAIAGEKGVHIIPDYRNVPVVSAYAPLNIPGLNWGILAEIDEEEAFAAVSELSSSIMTSAISVAIVMLAIGATLVWLGAKAIVKPILKLVETVSEIERDSDLTKRLDIQSKDELGVMASALNSMLDKFHTSMEAVAGNTSQVAAASEEMSNITTETNQAIQSQLTETGQVATAVTEMSSTVQEVANNTVTAAHAAHEANEAAAEGCKVVERTTTAIQKLAAEVDKGSEIIASVEKDSESIGTVLDVITDIAEQTNLLALNAAIEAARAGEHGRGFAVVADEVRTLASRTQQSTEEIQSIITKLQTSSRSAVKAMELGRDQAHNSVEQANLAGNALEKITVAVSSINDLNTQIASAAEEQTAVSEEISKNVLQINDMATHTSDGAQQTATASEQLAHLATDLQGLVNRFKI